MQIAAQWRPHTVIEKARPAGCGKPLRSQTVLIKKEGLHPAARPFGSQ